MQHNLWKYYLVSSIFSAGRMGIGATAVVYMLAQGASLGDIAMIKIVQALVIFFAEIPTGLIADTFGRRASLIGAAIASLISFVIFGVSDTVAGFAVAEIFNGLCIALWSGAFEALAVDQTRAHERGGTFLEFFFARIATYSALATMLGGLVGGFLGEISLVGPFVLSGFLMILGWILLSVLIPKDESEARSLQKPTWGLAGRFRAVLKKMHSHHVNAWSFSLSSPEIRSFFIIQILIQFSLQPMLHYWQPYFQNLSPSVTTQTLGILFFLYVGAQLVLSGLVSALFEKNRLSPESLNWIMGAVVFVTFAILTFSKNLALATGSFILLQGCYSSLRNNLAAGFNRLMRPEDRATVLSSVSFISRIGMLFNLAILKWTADAVPVSGVFLTSFLCMAMLLPYILKWNRISRWVRAV